MAVAQYAQATAIPCPPASRCRTTCASAGYVGRLMRHLLWQAAEGQLRQPRSTRARASPSRTPNTIPARSANRHPVQPLGVIDQAQHRPARRRVGQQRQDRQPDQEASGGGPSTSPNADPSARRCGPGSPFTPPRNGGARQ